MITYEFADPNFIRGEGLETDHGVLSRLKRSCVIPLTNQPVNNLSCEVENILGHWRKKTKYEKRGHRN